MIDDEIGLALLNALLSLRDVAEGSPPDLTDAPELREWLVVLADDGVSLVGRVTGHPILGNDRLIQTSALLAIAEDQSWARTLNRFYRLGRPRPSPTHR